jgi:hypothetical protein
VPKVLTTEEQPGARKARELPDDARFVHTVIERHSLTLVCQKLALDNPVEAS